jgi:hypothetical protein
VVCGGNRHVRVADSVFTANFDGLRGEESSLAYIIRVFDDFLGFCGIIAIRAENVLDAAALTMNGAISAKGVRCQLDAASEPVFKVLQKLRCVLACALGNAPVDDELFIVGQWT